MLDWRRDLGGLFVTQIPEEGGRGEGGGLIRIYSRSALTVLHIATTEITSWLCSIQVTNILLKLFVLTLLYFA